MLNPAADRGRAVRWRDFVSRFLEERGVEVIWHITGAGACETASSGGLPGEALVVAVGGDGTVHEVAAGCVGRDLSFGVLPVGSGNDYVKALGVARTWGGLRCSSLGEGSASWTPARSTELRSTTGSAWLRRRGRGRGSRAPGLPRGVGEYLWWVGRLLWGFPCREARSGSMAGGSEAETILVAVALGTTYGSMFRLAPEAEAGRRALRRRLVEEISRAEVLASYRRRSAARSRDTPRCTSRGRGRSRCSSRRRYRPTSMARSSLQRAPFGRGCCPEPLRVVAP